MNLVGVINAADFDASQPAGRRAVERRAACGTILLLGTGGSASFARVQAAQGGHLRAPGRRYHPIDRWSESVATAVLADLKAAGCLGAIARPEARPALNFRQLAEQCGIGAISPVIGHLLHPVFGPWVSLRIAILLDGQPFGPRPAISWDWDPCAGCPRPCVSACPAHAYSGDCSTHLERCASHRLAGGCKDGCATLHDCRLGREHRYSAAEERFRDAYSMFAIRRWYGAGLWNLVPQRIRRRL